MMRVITQDIGDTIRPLPRCEIATMKYCPSCSARYEDAAKFCQHDGTMLRNAVSKEEEDPYVGQILLGQFEIEEVIGEGGMGRVYRARQHGFDRPVAIKILHIDLVTNTEMVKRFNREAKIISRLDHPGIIHVYLFGELPDGNLYLAMEFVNGHGLTELIADGPVEVEPAIHITRQILGALTEAHRKGVVHRDLKPDNIMLMERPDDPLSVKVLDFGIAKFLGSRTMLTQQGLVFGSARYISPEAAAGETVDSRADLYAVGVILYQMLAGRPPFDDSSAVSLLMRHVNDPPPPLLDQPGAKDVPPAIAAVVMQSLKKDPAHRFDDAGAMRAALSEAAKVEGISLIGQEGMTPSRSWTSPPPEGSVTVDADLTIVDNDRDDTYRTDPMFGPAISRPSGSKISSAPSDGDAASPIGEEPRGPTTQISDSPLKEREEEPKKERQAAPTVASTPLPDLDETPAASSPLTSMPEPEPRAEIIYEEDEVRIPRSRAWIVLLFLLMAAIGGGAAAALYAGSRGGDTGEGVDSGVPGDHEGATVTPTLGPQRDAGAVAAENGNVPRPPSVEITAGRTSTKRAGVSTGPIENNIQPVPVGTPDAGAGGPTPKLLPNPETGPATDGGVEGTSMPPSASLSLEPRRPRVGRKIRLLAKVDPPSKLARPRFVIAHAGEKTVTVEATAAADGRYSAVHTFEKTGAHQITFVASSEDGELRAFSDVTVAARSRAKRIPPMKTLPDFGNPQRNIPPDPDNKPPDPNQPGLLPPPW